MIPKRRQLNGVLAGFLGTYTSRYSDFEGYWVFGFIVEAVDLLEIDLLAKPSSAAGAIAKSDELARTRFREQLRKHGFAESAAVEATLRIVPGAEQVERLAGDLRRPGRDVTFCASVLSDTGTRYTRTETVFVASHDPRFEQRSERAPA
jgi:hypothetical protein